MNPFQMFGVGTRRHPSWPPTSAGSLDVLVIRNPAAKLDSVKKQIVAACYFDIPADAIKQHGQPVA